MEELRDNWLKLDNAGLIYPAFASRRDPATFRVAVVLKEQVIQDDLQYALVKTLKEFPTMNVTLKKGLFWSYLDENNKVPKVLEEKKMPCTYINVNKGSGHLFQLFYYDKRISLECFHALTDGYGALEFLKGILFNYLKLREEVASDTLRLHGRDSEDKEDSYVTYATDKFSEMKSVKAAHIVGRPIIYEGAYVHHTKLSASKLNEFSKENDTTITVVLTALYIKALFKGVNKGAVVVTVPINLRKMFPSKTLRNFSYVMNVVIAHDMPLKAMINEINKQFKQQLNQEFLAGQISKNVHLQKQWGLRIVPNFIKSFSLRMARHFKSKRIVTSILTNPGIIDLPESMKEHVSHFETVLYASKPHYINMGVCSFNDQMVISLSRAIKEKYIIETFNELLAEHTGIELIKYSNEEA